MEIEHEYVTLFFLSQYFLWTFHFFATEYIDAKSVYKDTETLITLFLKVSGFHRFLSCKIY